MATDSQVAPDSGIQVDLGPDATNPPPDPDTAAPEATPNLLSLDRTKLHTELQRLERDDKEFANALNTFVGRKAARQYQPQIEELRAANAALEMASRRQQIASMPDADIEQRFRTDPRFAREYAEIVHSSPEDIAAVTQMAQLKVAVEEILNTGIDNGMTPEQAEEFRATIAQGKYDQDSSGRPITSIVALTRIQQDVMSQVLSSSRPAPTSTPPEAPKTNPNLLSPGPDVSQSGSKPRAGNLSDYKRALENGQNVSSEEIDRLVQSKWNIR